MYHQAFSVSHVYLRWYLWLQELFLVLVCGDREGGARFDHHVLLSQEAKADVASPRLMPGLSIHMDFFVRSLGPLCTQLWIFVNFSPVCLFSAQQEAKGQTGRDQIPAWDEANHTLLHLSFAQPLFSFRILLHEIISFDKLKRVCIKQLTCCCLQLVVNEEDLFLSKATTHPWSMQDIEDS